MTADAAAMSAANRKTALVSGGTGSIGRAICLKLAREGYDLAFTYHRNRDGAQALAALIEELGRKVVYSSVALDAMEEVRRFVDSAVDSLGQIGAVVYASGPDLQMKSIADMDAADWSHVVDVDVKGAFHLVSCCLPHLRAHGTAAVVAVLAAAIKRLPRNDLMSAGPKAAIEMLIKSLAKEEGRHGIRANCVAPGWINGGIGARFLENSTPEFIAKTRRTVPLQRFGEPNDVADLVAFLLSEQAGYISGQTIAVDGGMQI